MSTSPQSLCDSPLPSISLVPCPCWPLRLAERFFLRWPYQKTRGYSGWSLDHPQLMVSLHPVARTLKGQVSRGFEIGQKEKGIEEGAGRIRRSGTKFGLVKLDKPEYNTLANKHNFFTIISLSA